ncbi:hypothetical protein KAW64_07775 [bacterium]|nr:hypothetical protein [bacterium]
MKRALILCVCLLMVASVALAAKPNTSKVADDVMFPIFDPYRPYFEGFEGGVVPPAGWWAIVNNPFTWELGDYSPLEGLYYATCYYDPSLGQQDEWICFEYTLEAGDECLSFYAFASTYWAIDPYQNYNLIVTVNGQEVWNYYDDNAGAVTWQWQQYSVELEGYGPGDGLEVCFGYVGSDGAQGSFDAIEIGECPVIPEPCCPCDYYRYVVDFNEYDNGWYSVECGIGPIPWEWGVPVGIPSVACDDVPVTHVLATVLAGDYPVQKGEGAVVGPFEITPDCHCLELCHYYDIESGFDGGNVKVSWDGGATWQLIYPFRGYDDILDSSSFIAECTWGEEVFCGSSGIFIRDCFDLTAYASQTLLVGFFFGSDSSVTYPGWYIKWLKIGGDEPSATEDATWGSIKAMYR